MPPALVIIDMQNDFLTKGVPQSLPNILKLHDFFTQKSWPVIFTQHGHTKEELTPPYPNQLVRKWGPKDSIAIGSHAWEFVPEIATLTKREHPSQYVLKGKNTYDSFLHTNLAEILTGEQVDRVVVVGVMTDCCCDTTGRGAFNRGYETWVVRDACGTASEEQHQRGLAVFSYAYGEIPTTDETIKRLEGE